MMSEKLRLQYTEKENIRLDKYLVSLNLPALFSRTYIEKVIIEGLVSVNGLKEKKSCLLQTGDEIEIQIPEIPPTELIPQNIPLEIIFEDEHLAVINKPADMIIHPGFGNKDNTLANALVFHYGQNFNVDEGNNRPGIVHRLDKGTTGLVLISKNAATQSILSEMFAQRKVKKTYLAITTGIPDPPEGKIETNIARSVSNPRKMTVCETGRNSLTLYKVIRYYYFFALCEVALETGRMHQIRVHFADNNIPVLGDTLYNSIKYTQSIVPENMKKKVMELLTNHLKRQALHAWKLQFTHPYTNDPLIFTAPLPDDLKFTLDWLENYFAIDNVRYDKKLLNS